MLVFGYTKTGEVCHELREVTFVVTPAELRELAGFLLYAADDQERRPGAEYVHMSHHVTDTDGNCILPWKGPDVIVTPPGR